MPPSPAQRSGDTQAYAAVFIADEAERVALATAALGLGLTAAGDTWRVAGTHIQLEALAAELTARGSPAGEALRRALNPAKAWRTRTRSLALDRPWIMGIVNLTNDSFSGDGVGRNATKALAYAAKLREAGADLIDAGAESARADRPTLDEAEEAALIGPLVAALATEGLAVSVDSYKPAVAKAALESGAEVVNDISGLTLGVGAAEEAARAGAGYVLNYSYSVPKRRPDTPPVYADVVAETLGWMSARIERLRALGLGDDAIAVDPGIAFGKSHEEDIRTLSRLGEFASLGLPILLAHSRKNFVGSITGRRPAERDLETHVVAALAFEQGARIFRVHDPEGARRALEVAKALTALNPGVYAPDAESWPWRAGASAAHMTTATPDKPAPPGQRW